MYLIIGTVVIIFTLITGLIINIIINSDIDSIGIWIIALIIININITLRIINIIKQSIRNKAAKNIMKDFNYKKETEEITNIGKTYIKNIDCPICNGLLEIKRGKNGEFIGCKNYPKCSFTKNI